MRSAQPLAPLTATTTVPSSIHPPSRVRNRSSASSLPVSSSPADGSPGTAARAASRSQAIDEDELAKRRAARREHPSSLPANLSAYPWNDESPTELQARLEAMQKLLIDVAEALDDHEMHDLAEVLRRAAQ